MIAVATKTMFVGTLVGIAHILSGIAVFITPMAGNVTPIADLSTLLRHMGFDSGVMAAILIFAGIMAVIAGTMPRASHVLHGILFLPQQLLLVLQIYTITVALTHGVYPDGYAPQGGAWFILSDQIWAWLLAASHSIWLAAFLYGGSIKRGTGRTS